MKQYTTKTASLRTTIGQIKKVYADTVYINDTSEGNKNCGAPTNIIDVVTSWGITFPNNDGVSFTIPSATAEVDGVVYIATDINDERSNAVVSATLLKNTLNQFYYDNFGYVDGGSGGGENDLSGFTALAYLESDGGSWIDTEMALSQNHSVYLTARYNSLTSSYSTDGGFAYGYRTSYDGGDGHCFILNGVPSAYFTYGNAQNSNIGNIWEGNDLTICNTQQQGYIKYTNSNGVEQTITIRSAYSGNGFTTSGTAYLFALNTPNGDVRRINGRIYEYKVVDETTGEIVQHLLPYLDRDGVPCMYDIVQKKAHYNIGEKQFTYGQGVYEFFEYVQNQSDRIDENIDLELTLGVDITPFELTMEYEVYHISGNVNFVGNWRSSTNSWLVCNKAYFEVLVPYSTVSVTRKATPVNLTIKHAPTYVTCNGTTYNITPANTSDVLPLKVLGSSSANPGIKQYKWVKIYNNGKLIRDLIPAKRLSDNWVGMYCKLNNKFYGGTNPDSFLVP